MGSAYSPIVIEHYRRPRNFGALEAPDVAQEGANLLCGDRIRIELKLAGDVVEAARFRGDACAVTVAAASLLTERVSGQTLAAVEALAPPDVMALLGVEVPPARRRCATLPLEVLQAGVRAYRERAARTGPVAAVVLAAGAARRFGAQKLLAPAGGKPIVRWTVEHALAARLDPVVVVLGREADAVRAALDDLPLRFVTNPDFAAGMSTSLRSGLAAVGSGPAAAVVLLGDQPVVGPAVIDRIVERYRATHHAIVAPVYAGVRGNPVLFDASLFPELLAVTGDEGARALVARDPSRVARVEFDFPMPVDVDTPEDYARLIATGGP